jgi:hypothetical protein
MPQVSIRRGHVFRAVSLAAALALLTAGAALADAGGRGTVTTTQQFRGLVFSHDTTNPCNGQPGTLTAWAKTGVFHITSFATGEYWLTGTDEGTATFTPNDPTGVTASGHYAEWFGESFNNKNDVQHDTSTFNLKGSDGSHVIATAVDHFSTNANGVVTVTFSDFNLHCG